MGHGSIARTNRTRRSPDGGVVVCPLRLGAFGAGVPEPWISGIASAGVAEVASVGFTSTSVLGDRDGFTAGADGECPVAAGVGSAGRLGGVVDVTSPSLGSRGSGSNESASMSMGATSRARRSCGPHRTYAEPARPWCVSVPSMLVKDQLAGADSWSASFATVPYWFPSFPFKNPQTRAASCSDSQAGGRWSTPDRHGDADHMP